MPFKQLLLDHREVSPQYPDLNPNRKVERIACTPQTPVQFKTQTAPQKEPVTRHRRTGKTNAQRVLNSTCIYQSALAAAHAAAAMAAALVAAAVAAAAAMAVAAMAVVATAVASVAAAYAADAPGSGRGRG